MKKKILILLFFLTFTQSHSIETKIIHNIQNEIITNTDIKKEFRYLVALNSSLKKLNKEQILSISSDSIIREKIKKIEILRNFKEIKINEDYLNLLLRNIYSRINLKSIIEFEKYLIDYDLKIDDIKMKVTIDALWNELIINKYKDKISINKNKIKEEILKNNKTYSKQYQLSEIIFEVTSKEEIEKKYNEVVKSIDEIGFKNSAATYSVSETSKIGGDIGWINESSLTNSIKKNINTLQITFLGTHAAFDRDRVGYVAVIGELEA